MAYKITLTGDDFSTGIKVLSSPEVKTGFSSLNFNVLKDNFIDVVKNKYFCFEGVTGRTVFWRYMIVAILILVAAGIVSNILGIIFAPLFAIQGLVYLALLCPTIGITARRLHDIGRSGWLQLISLVPFVGGLIVLILCLLPKAGEDCCCGCGCEQK